MLAETRLPPDLALQIQHVLSASHADASNERADTGAHEVVTGAFDTPPHLFDVVAVLNRFFPDCGCACCSSYLTYTS
jgi:hypothetical protein